MRLIDADALMTEFMDSDLDHLQRDDWREVIQIVTDAPTVNPEPHWIPVTEDTLPEEGRIVVVHGEKGTWDYGKYRGYGPNIHYWYWKNKTFKKAYWWMYKEDALPEPTREVTE
jgi:hypothetical protein